MARGSRLESTDFGTLSRRAPGEAGDLAFRRFCTPRLSERRSEDHRKLVERARPLLRGADRMSVPTRHGPVEAYVLEPAAASAHTNVLIAHGWTSEAAFMALFAEQLRRAGFRAVAFDQPGHGRSRREQASLVDCTRALIDVAAALGPFRFVVAHSMGCLAALLAGCGGPPFGDPVPFERYVLVSSPNRFSDVTDEFAVEVGLDPIAYRAFIRRIERVAARPLAAFRADRLLLETGKSALLLHARDDREVLFARSEEIAAACPGAELVAFDGFGHRMILSAPPVVRRAVLYLSEV